MEPKLWMAGEPRTPEPLCELAGRALRYGDGVFVTLACREGILLDAEAQIGRLTRACERVELTVPETAASVSALLDVLRSIGARGDGDFVVRVQVSAGPSGRGYGRSGDDSWELIEVSEPPSARECRVAVAGPDLRLPVPALPSVKSCSALAHVLAAREAARMGVHELIRTADGRVTEAIAANVFWTAGDVLRTPAASLPIYPGMTRALVLEVAGQVGLEVDEGEHDGASLAAADGVFLTNATRGVEPVAELDGESTRWPEPLARLAAAVDEARRTRGTRL